MQYYIQTRSTDVAENADRTAFNYMALDGSHTRRYAKCSKSGLKVKQDSWAIAKKTARCAQYMRALKSFDSRHYAPGYFSRNS